MMRRIGLCLASLALLALPAGSQTSPVPACRAAKAGASPMKGFEAAVTHQPLEPGQRLFYGLAGVRQDSPLEVRYFVQGKPYLTEVVNLATAQLPRIDAGKPKSPLKSRTALDLDAERMIELLALRPDLVRQLRQLAQQKDTAIQIEVRQEGRLLESLSLQALTERSAELGRGEAVPLAVKAAVSGPGDRGGDKIRSAVAYEYFESCSECTNSTPCETECGYDPGKGGPVTCGEYGVCNYNPTCSCSTTVSDSWSDWYLYRSYFTNQAACLRSFTAGSAWHQRYVEEYRRDRIRRNYVCPNCPSCTGCYYQNQLIEYQLGYADCWFEGAQVCSGGSIPCCSDLCEVGPFTPCYSC